MKKTILCMILLLAWCGAAYGFAGGDGTQGNPYQVQTAAHLDTVRNDLTAYYVQVADIDVASYTNWTPIAGGGTTDIFTGSYDGQNYTISNLTIDRSGTANVGLFGHVGEGAVIQNVRLETVSVEGLRGVGSLIGRVSGSDTTLILRCYADGGTVVGYDGATGGLVGSHNSVDETPGGENNPVISQCYANIDVSLADPATGPGLDKFGGLAGCSQKGTILDSYARGSVTVNNANAQRVGGLVGCNERRGRIIRSYSTGAVSSTGTLVGGLLGNIDSPGVNDGIVEDSYWDTQTSGQSTSAGGEGKTTTEMKTQATFANWDFATIWGIDPGTNDGYPYLLWEDNDPPPSGGIGWTGTTNTDWNTATNWNPQSVPTLVDDVTIPTGATNEPVIAPQVIAQVHNLTVDAGATLTIQSNGTNTGALIVSGQSTGDVTVERYLEGDRWYIIGSPVLDQGISALLTNAGNSIAYDTATGNYGATDYNEADNKWNDYFTDATPGVFNNGTGYLLRRQTTAGAVTFTGALETGSVDEPIATLGFHWNAVGNPYSAAIGITGNASTPNNFLFFNRDNLDVRHIAIYIWDDILGNYVIVSNANFSNVLYDAWETNYVQLGQGFIVRAAAGGSVVTFTPEMRLGNSALMLKSLVMGAQRSAPLAASSKVQWPGVVISATANNGADTASTGIAFYEGMSLGLDPGSDIGVLSGNPEVAVYTQLAAGDDGEDYGLQVLPPSAMDGAVLAVGVETRKSGTIIFRFEKTGLPQNTVLILEDRKENTETAITAQNDTYAATVDSEEPAYGRFYLSFTDDADGADDDDNGGSSGGCFIGTAAFFGR